MDSLSIRALTAGDWPAVRAIYEEGIASGDATFETSPPEWDEWDAAHLASPRLVAESTDGVVGWAALSLVSQRAVYAGVAEVSIYVAAAARGRGVGAALLEALVRDSERAGIWTLQAGTFPENRASLALHERAGFRRVGYRERLGEGGGRWRDVVVLERRSSTVGFGDTLPAGPPADWPVIRTPRLRLNAPEPSDAPVIQRLADDIDIARNTLSFPHPYGPGEAERFIGRSYRQYGLGDGINFAIRDVSSGELMGTIGLRIDRANAVAETGYWIGAPYRRRGYATEALKAILGFAFGEIGLHRVHAHHFARNPASGEVMQKAGMRREGTLRGGIRKLGTFEDLVLYAAVRSDHGWIDGTSAAGTGPKT